MSDTDMKNTMQWWILQYEESDMERRRLEGVIADMRTTIDKLRSEIEGLNAVNAALYSSVSSLGRLNNELVNRIPENSPVR